MPEISRHQKYKPTYNNKVHLGPDHVQMNKVNCRLKVNWNDVAQKYKKIFTIHFTILVDVVNHVP